MKIRDKEQINNNMEEDSIYRVESNQLIIIFIISINMLNRIIMYKTYYKTLIHNSNNSNNNSKVTIISNHQIDLNQ